MVLLKPDFNATLLQEAGVDFVLSGSPVALELVAAFDGWALYAVPPSPGKPAIQTISSTMNTKTVSVRGSESVTLPESLVPGWQIDRGDGWAPLEGPTEPGENLRIAYRPGSFRWGLFALGVGVAAILAISYRRRREHEHPDAS
jgi:hypothetical protein